MIDSVSPTRYQEHLKKYIGDFKKGDKVVVTDLTQSLFVFSVDREIRKKRAKELIDAGHAFNIEHTELVSIHDDSPILLSSIPLGENECLDRDSVIFWINAMGIKKAEDSEAELFIDSLYK